MVSTSEPLLSPPLISKTTTTNYYYSPCINKALLIITLSLVTLIIISLTSLFTLQSLISSSSSNPNPNTSISSLLLQPSHLCTTSPNPSTCHVIVSDILLLTPSNSPTTPLHLFNSLITKSLHQIDDVIHYTNNINNNIVSVPPLADCNHLMDVSRDRLIDSIAAITAGAHSTDARTWLSAVLTNHATCLDGLAVSGTTVSELESELKVLMDTVSAALAVLNSVEAMSQRGVLDEWPAWLSSFWDSWKLMEASVNVVVAKDGSGKYKTVQEAVNSAPDKGSSRYVIYVKKGVYKENVEIGKKKTNVMIVGDGMDATVITGSLNVVDGSTTFNSATLAANADDLILQDLKIENTAGPAKHQAVALRVSADRSAINRCKIEGYQDTLYAHSLRQFYRDSYISGTIDFIFGNAAVVFQNCTIVARKPMTKQKNTITAQGRTDPNENTGTSIQKCKIVPSSDLIPEEGSFPTYLGRPWKQYSRTVIMQSYLDSHINPKGWLEWDGDFALKTLFYGEYQNSGPGAGTSGRVNWPGFKVITDANTAESFTVAALIQGGSWLKSTGVAFTEGL